MDQGARAKKAPRSPDMQGVRIAKVPKYVCRTHLDFNHGGGKTRIFDRLFTTYFTVPAQGRRVVRDRLDSCYGIGKDTAYTEYVFLNTFPLSNQHGRPSEEEYMDRFLEANIVLRHKLGDATQK